MIVEMSHIHVNSMHLDVKNWLHTEYAPLDSPYTKTNRFKQDGLSRWLQALHRFRADVRKGWPM
jgi:hypothetical protein